jgi:hypothetical protein
LSYSTLAIRVSTKTFLFGFPNKTLENEYKMGYDVYYKIISNQYVVRFPERKAVFRGQFFWGEPKPWTSTKCLQSSATSVSKSKKQS